MLASWPTVRRLAVGCAAVAVAAAGSAAAQKSEDLKTGRDVLSVEQQSIANVPVPASDLRVQVWLDRPDGQYALGDTMKLWVQPSKTAYLTVLNVGTTGKVTVLYPNAREGASPVTANQTVQIPAPNAPYSLRLDGPPGTELIKVFASSQPLQLTQQAGTVQVGVFAALPGTATTVSRDIGAAVAAQPAVEWSQTNQVVQVGGPRPAMAPAPVAVAPVAVPPVPVAVPAWTVPQVPTTGQPFNLTLVTSKPVYRIGEPLQVFVTADRPCTLSVLNVGTSGTVTMLFPNQRQPNNQLQAGQTIVLGAPGSPVPLAVGGPPGSERLIALCRTDGQTALAGQPLGTITTVSRDIGMLAAQAPNVQAQSEVVVTVTP